MTEHPSEVLEQNLFICRRSGSPPPHNKFSKRMLRTDASGWLVVRLAGHPPPEVKRRQFDRVTANVLHKTEEKL